MLTEVLSPPFCQADFEAGIPDLSVGDPGDRGVIRYILASVVVAPAFFVCRGPDCHLGLNQPTGCELSAARAREFTATAENIAD